MYSAPDLYASLLLLVAASAVLGQGILCACGRRTWSWLAPAVGLATLVVIAGATIRLPGRGLTATFAVGVALLASLALLWMRHPPLRRAFRVGFPVVAAIVLAASVPFIVGGGFGAFVGKSNDLGYYLYDAQWLQTHAGFEPGQIVDAYPMGPPALAVVIAKATGGTSLVASFTAFMMTVAVAAGLASLALFGELPPGRRTLAGFLVGLPYMGASFYLQSSFKEMAVGLFALTFALSLRELGSDPVAADPVGADSGSGSDPLPRPALLRAIVPLALLVAAAVYTYSFAGIYWPAATVALWAVGFALLDRRRPIAWIRSRRWELPRSRRSRILAAVATLAVLALVIPELRQVIDFARGRGSLGSLYGGNAFGDLPRMPWFYTGLGIWPVTDYRATPPSMLVERLWFAVALIVFARGALELVRKRELAVIAATGAAGLLYLAARWASGPYVQSKALAIMAPLTMLVTLYGAFGPPVRRSWKLVVAPVFLVGALLSTYLALGGGLVNTGEQARQLEALGGRIQGARLLFLGTDDYVGWELRGASVLGSDPADGVFLAARARPNMSWRRYDWDSVNRGALDYVDYVIAARTPFQSEPPPNFKRVAATQSFVLWKRTGPTPPRRALFEGALPGKVLRCQGRRLNPRAVARVWSHPPVLGPFSAWQASTPPPPSAGFGFPTALTEGRSLTQSLPLGKGVWTISLQYSSAEPVGVQTPGLDVRLPPNFQRLGSFWPVGTITLSKPRRVPFKVELEPLPALRNFFSGPDRLNTGFPGLTAGIGATRVPDRHVTIPLRRACGRFVDWYRPR